MEVNVNLSTNDIRKLIQQLENMKSAISELEKTLPEELANKTVEQMETYYNSGVTESTNEPTKFRVDKEDNGASAVAYGSGVAYEEFGTGDMGERKPHPDKGKYPLRDYNTGEFIRSTDELPQSIMQNYGLQDGNYWIYAGADGKYYRQGIEPGLFMFNADAWLRKNYKDIIAKKVDDALRKH